jgi:hypothetical protein
VKIFVSYSRRDAGDFANQIRRHLSTFNYDIFTDVYDIKGGDIWSNTIEENISNCDIFVIIVTYGALHSPHVEREVLQAQNQNKIIIPCMHEDVEHNEIKWGLEKIQGVEFSDKYELTRKLYPKIKNYENIVQEKPNILPQQKKNEETNNPEDVNPLHQKGRSLYADNKYKEAIDQEAIDYHDKALRIDPNNAAALIDKGNEFYDQHKLPEALEYYDKALRADPNHIEALSRKGSILNIQ